MLLPACFLKELKFLWKGYNTEQHPYWEAVILLRKLAMQSISVLLSDVYVQVSLFFPHHSLPALRAPFHRPVALPCTSIFLLCTPCPPPMMQVSLASWVLVVATVLQLVYGCILVCLA